MVNSKNALMKILKSNKEKIQFENVRHWRSWQVGIIREVGDIVQSNAFTIKTKRDNEYINSWVYLSDIEVKNNIITYKNNKDIEIRIIEK